MGFGFVFPGQGSQSIGMLAGLAATDPVVFATFAEASDVLGYDLWRLVQDGPVAELNETERTQPAMLAAGVATWRAWRARGGPLPECVAGHSLGEYTALVCAEALEFRAAVELVRFRGNAMQHAVPVGAGLLAAILGLEDAAVEAACAEAAQGEVCEAVNYNAPSQVVIAGHTAAVTRAMDAAKRRGAKRAVPLAVSVPVHSSLMRVPAARLGERLAGIALRAPAIRYVSAVDARTYRDPEAIRALLVRQLASPVRWSQTVLALTAGGLRQLIECGPGKILTALNRRIDRRPELECLALENGASIQAALAAVSTVTEAG
jgi:[acyl-carrier-protein] S-malonyltransferase